MAHDIAKNIAYLTHGMALMFFMLASYNLFKLQKNSRLLKFLFYEFLLFLLIEIKDLIYINDALWDNDYVNHVFFSIDLIVVPVTIIFLFELITPYWVSLRKTLLIVSPSIILTLLYVFSDISSFYHILIVWSVVMGISSIIVVFFVSVQYDKIIERNFSYVENINIKWIRYTISALFVYLLVWVALQKYDNWWADAFYYLLSIYLWWTVYHYSIRHVVVKFPELYDFFKKNDKSTIISKQNQWKNKYIDKDKLDKIMKEQMIFLNPKLNVQDLANIIGTNRTYLSSYLNKELHLTFYAYINAYRIQYACSILKTNCSINFEDLAELSGFNSFSTFRRAFFVTVKMTPTQYRNQFC